MNVRQRREQRAAMDIVLGIRTRMVRYTITFERDGVITGAAGTISYRNIDQLLERKRQAEWMGLKVTLDMESGK